MKEFRLDFRYWRCVIAWLMIFLLAITSGPSSTVLAAEATNTGKARRSAGRQGTAAAQQSSTKKVRRPTVAELTKPIKRNLVFSNTPSDLEILDSRVFFEPLVPMDNKVIPSENQALARALLAYKGKQNREDITDLNGFIKAHPNSRWRPSLETDIGEARFETGYLTEALQYWTFAWDSSKAQTKPERKAVADAAISHLVLLEAQLGLMPALEKHLSEIEKRTLTGSVEQRVKGARAGLWSMKHHPEISFKCGPFAINMLAKVLAPQRAINCGETMTKAASTSHGTNLTQLQDWSQQVGLKLQMAKRSAGSAFISPALLHWKVGHFAAVTAKAGARYRVQDPTFGDQGNLWISKPALESQTDGYFLVPEGKLPTGWRRVSREEGAKVWGKGLAYFQDQGKSQPCPKECMMCPCPGLAGASAFSMNATLSISDNPLGYNPPAGPSMAINIIYCYNQGNQPGTFTFTNLGFDWNLNWLSYLTVDIHSNVTVRPRGGGYEVYNYPYAGTPNLMSQAEMVSLGSNSYQRLLPDGSVENFTLYDGTNTYLTSVVDPQGNAATLSYDAHYRLTSITDPCGNSATTVAYVSNTYGNVGFYKVASITDGFGRSTSFSYDSTTTYLLSITDAVGNVSQFSYDTSSSFINMLTTPYGSTTFYQYTPAGGNPSYLPVGLRTTYPDGTSSVIENWIGEQKASYYWDREAASLYPTDPANHNYHHCKCTRWLFESSINSASPVANFTRAALEAPVVYSYPGETSEDVVGSSNQPTQIARQLSGYKWTATVSGTVTTGNVIGIKVTDPYVQVSAEIVSYTVQAGDSLSSIASALAAGINADAYLSTYGITATAASNVITITSLSIVQSTYTFYSTGSPTESITFAAAPNQGETATLAGSITSGDVLTVTVHNSGLTGGQESASYTVQSNDTFGTISQGLAVAINSDTHLQGINVSAYWNVPSTGGSLVSIQSNSTNATTYTSSTSGGATETITLASTTNGIVQATNYKRNTLGYMTQSIDPIGRQFTYTYASNNIDLVKVQENQGGDTATIGGTIHVGDTVTLTVYDAGLTGGTEPVTVSVMTGDFLNFVASRLANAINADTHLSAIGVSATASGTVVTMSSLSVNTTTYKGSTSAGATETITLNINTCTLGFWQYNSYHRPTAYIDGSGQETQYTYNTPYEELATITDANSNTTTLSYNGNGYLTKIQGPLSGSQDITTFTFYGYGLVNTVTDSEGYTLTYSYDNLNRLTTTTYPDGTSEQIIYDKLDAVMRSDRLGRWTKDIYNSMDQLVTEVDPLGRKTQYCWCTCGSLASLTDPANNITSWQHDLEGRVTEKVYPDQSTVSYVYQANISLVQSKTDALSQVTSYAYNIDNSLQETSYSNTVNATSAVTTAYDQKFQRVTSTNNGWGKVTNSYNPYINSVTNTGYIFIGGYPQTPNATDTISVTVFNSALAGGQYTMPTYSVLSGDAGQPAQVATHLASTITSNATLSAAGIAATASGTLITITGGSAVSVTVSGTGSTTASVGGGGRLSQVTNSVISNSATAYSYDSLGRTTTRMINGGNNQTNWTFDAMSRITNEQNPLGTFNYAYVDDVSGSSKGTTRLASITYPNSQVTNFSYYPNVGDQRLQQIVNLNPTSNALSQFNYGYDSAGEITRWSQQQANSHSNYGLGYDTASQLVSAQAGIGTAAPPFANQYYYNYDGAANRTAVQQSQLQNGSIGGTATPGDTVTITVHDLALSGGQEAVSYVVQALDTTSTIAANLAASMSSDSNLQTVGIDATSNASLINLRSKTSNITTYTASVSGTLPTETVTIGTNKNLENVTIGGTVHTSDVLTLTILDPALTGGSQSITYTVLLTDTAASIATAMTLLINSSLTLSNAGITATSANQVISVQSLSPNVTTYATSVSGVGATTTITAGLSLNGSQNALIGGSTSSGDVLTITVQDSGLSGGSETVSYTVVLGDTPTSVASSLAGAINTDSNLQAIGVTATSSSANLIATSVSTNVTSYLFGRSAGATETILWGLPPNGTQTAAIGGSKTTGDTLTITVFDASLTGGSHSVSYTVLSTDSNLAAVASGLATAINNDTSLQAIGVSATAVAAVVNVTSASSTATTYTESLNTGATESITLSTNVGVAQFAYNNLNELTSFAPGGATRFQGTSVNPITSTVININQNATVSGSVTVGDIVTLIVHNSALSSAEFANYTVQPGDSFTSIATGLAAAITADATLSAIGVTATSAGAVVSIASSSKNATTYTATVSTGATETISLGGTLSKAATLSWSQSFSGNPVLATGGNTASVTALSGGGTPATTSYQLSVSNGTSKSLTYDSNGNLTNDGTNAYSWDAENRLIQITYPGSGNNSQFTYDGLGRCAKIVETTSGSVTSTRQFLWCGNQRSEVRDGTSNLISQYFGQGQVNFSGSTGTDYYYTLDHQGSIRETTNSSGATESQFCYDPWGYSTRIAGSGVVSDFGYGKYYVHARSGLSLTKFRAYSPRLARWLSRDPSGERVAINMYSYGGVSNNPISFVDPLGLDGGSMIYGEHPMQQLGGQWNTGALFSPVGLLHYMFGFTSPLSVDFAKVNLSTLDLMTFADVQNAIEQAKNSCGSAPFSFSTTFQTTGDDQNSLGVITLKITGSVTVNSDGSISVDAVVKSYSDVYDFGGRQAHRSNGANNLVQIGNYIPGMKYGVNFTGSQTIHLTIPGN